nr:PadR family transcriptional regulator [Clostridiales bacterium]
MDEEFDAEEELEKAESDEKDGRAISADLIRGHINTIILRSLDDGDKYGYEIIAEIEKKSHGQYSLKQPSLYSALKRLEKDGYVTSYWGGSVGGGRRKYFSLTEDGKSVSEQNRSEWEYSRTVIDSLISEKD